MDIEIKLFTPEYAERVLNLQQEWVHEFITAGLCSDTIEDILGYQNEYFYIALDGDIVIGYTTARLIHGNEYNVFPLGSDYVQIDDLYVKAEYRNYKIGEKLLHAVEETVEKNGITNIFISSSTFDADAVRRFYTRNGYNIWTTLFAKRMKYVTRIYDLDTLSPYMFVVIFAKYKGKWVYARHKKRSTWETAGGHIELGETPLDAAKRELYEETGAVKFDIKPMFDYSSYDNEGYANGQVYLAEVEEFADIPESEMAEIMFSDSYPDELTYPDILPVLYERIRSMTKE